MGEAPGRRRHRPPGWWIVAASVLFTSVVGGQTPTVAISGLAAIPIVMVRVEGAQVILESADGRLFSVPLATAGVEALLQASREQARRDRPAPLPSPSEIAKMLRQGISEQTLRALIETAASGGARYQLSTESVLELKAAGASEAFLQYLIGLGRGPKITWLRWRSPSRAPGEESPPATLDEPAPKDSVPEGIPYYPYGFPGYGIWSSGPSVCGSGGIGRPGHPGRPEPERRPTRGASLVNPKPQLRGKSTRSELGVGAGIRPSLPPRIGNPPERPHSTGGGPPRITGSDPAGGNRSLVRKQ